jgi:2',3'-cyclic-nucleotide 2'-phosphodiesterase (5'-nucleotidase family)
LTGGARAQRWSGGAATLVAVALTAPAATAEMSPARAASAPGSAAPTEILFHADLDGRFAPLCGQPLAAASDYAGLLASIDGRRAAALADGARPPVVLLGGNWAGPDPLITEILSGGAAGAHTVAGLLGRGQYDAIALGHEELSLAPALFDELLPVLARAGRPLVASNLTCDARRPACGAIKRDILVHRPDAVIGVLSVVSPSVIPGIAPGRMAGLGLSDPVAAVREGVKRLRAAGATRVVVLTDGPRDTRALDEIDVLQRHLGEPGAPDLLLAAGLADEETGRTVRLLRRDGAPPVVGSALGAGALTVVELAGDEVSADAVPTAPGARDPEIERLTATAVATTCARAAQPAAPAPVKGTLTRDDFRSYVLEVMRRRAGAEIALINAPFVKRGPFPINGTLTRGDLERALPYRAVIGAARVQGPVVESLLGPALGNGKLAVIGLAKAASGLQVNGRPLDKAREYRVATIAFVAEGGDGIFAPHALPFAPLPGAPDLRDAVVAFFAHDTAAEDGDPTVNAKTDFGRPPAARPLLVALADGEFDFSETSISNGPGYGDPQLTRAQQTLLKGEATLVTQLRQPIHEADGRLDLQYGWSSNKPPGMLEVSGETADLITAIVSYSYKGLHDWRRVPKPFIPDPYARVWLESEFTRPEVTPTQTRTYHHLQLTNTVGAQFTLTPRLRLRAGAGAQSELLAPPPDGGWHAVIEAGGTLDPTAIATVGALAIKLEGLFDYDFVDPTGTRQHQLRASGKLSVPLLPALFLTVGLEVFAVQRQELGWAASYDTTIGLRLHTDVAHQSL